MVIKKGAMRAAAESRARHQTEEEDVSDYEVEQPATKKKKPQTKKAKGKGIAQPSRTREAEADDSDVPQPNPRTKPTAKKGDSTQPSKSKPTPALRLKKMRQMTFTQTRWADHQLLRELGIYDCVSALFRNMGLEGLFHMDCVAYKEATQDFIATFDFYDDTSLNMGDENRGRISFRVNGTQYEMPLAQLGALFHFPRGGEVSTLVIDRNEAQGVWLTIASGNYTKGTSKAARIRHPALRYAHKFLAHTLYERRETGAVKEDELALLIEGVKPFLRTDRFDDTIIGQPNRIHLAHLLVNRFRYYQDWVITNRDTKPTIGFGGLITPILLAVGAILAPVPSSTPVLRIDASYLSTSHFLVGKLSNRRYGYRFKTIEDGEKVMILPHFGLTTLQERDNVLFNLRPIHLHDPHRDGHLASIKKAPTAQRDEEAEEAIPETVYGSSRYDFEPYAEAISGEALREAHEQIGKLKRWIKWQNKNIKKLCKKVKDQGKKLKQLFKERRDEGEGPSWPMILSDAQPEDAAPSSRRNRGKAPISPSSSDSGNYPYDMDSSSSDST